MNGSLASQRQVLVLQFVTVTWMSIEVALSAFAAIRAKSPALAGFDGDSAIELAPAAVVFLRFKHSQCVNEERATRVTAWLLFALAIFIVLTSILVIVRPDLQPEPSYLGIALLLAAQHF